MPEETTCRPTDASPDYNDLTLQQRADLADEVSQAEYRRSYEEQQRRRACPGCGES